LLLGGGQHALQADHKEIAQQVGVNILGTSAHVFLLETRNSRANGGFNLSMGFHGTFCAW